MGLPTGRSTILGTPIGVAFLILLPVVVVVPSSVAAAVAVGASVLRISSAPAPGSEVVLSRGGRRGKMKAQQFIGTGSLLLLMILRIATHDDGLVGDGGAPMRWQCLSSTEEDDREIAMF
jgi:hypothetical protein